MCPPWGRIPIPSLYGKRCLLWPKAGTPRLARGGCAQRALAPEKVGCTDERMQGADSELLGSPTQAEIEAIKAVGLQPRAFGYDPTGRLMRRRDDASLECLLDEEQGSLTAGIDDEWHR